MAYSNYEEYLAAQKAYGFYPLPKDEWERLWGPNAAKTAVTHYELTRAEALPLSTSNWIDPKDFAQHPWMICRTGDGHARGTRSENAVTCPACKAALKQKGLL